MITVEHSRSSLREPRGKGGANFKFEILSRAISAFDLLASGCELYIAVLARAAGESRAASSDTRVCADPAFAALDGREGSLPLSILFAPTRPPCAFE